MYGCFEGVGEWEECGSWHFARVERIACAIAGEGKPAVNSGISPKMLAILPFVLLLQKARFCG